MNDYKHLRIGILIDYIEGRYQSPIAKGLSDYAKKHHFKFIYFIGRSLNTPLKHDLLKNSIYKLAKSHKLDGIIAFSGSIGHYLTKAKKNDFFKGYNKIPIVTIGSIIKDIPGIIIDNVTGVYEATSHLINIHGHKNIAFVSGDESQNDSAERFEGFSNAMSEAKLTINKSLIFKENSRSNYILSITENLIKGKSLICDSIICGNDELALGIITALSKRGFYVPRDFSIIGFDNINDSLSSLPPLTTVHQPLYYQAELACRMISDMILDKEVPLITKLDVSLIIRESCGCGNIPPLKNRYKAINHNSKDSLSSMNLLETVNDIINVIKPEIGNMNEIKNALSGLLDNIILDIKLLRNQSIFLQVLNDWLNITFVWDRYTEIWHEIFSSCQNEIMKLLSEEKEEQYLNELFQRAYTAVALKNSQRESRKLNDMRLFLSAYKELSIKLNTSISISDIEVNLGRDLPNCGITKAYLVLNNEVTDDLQKSVTLRFLLNSEQDKRTNYAFDSMEILPEKYLEKMSCNSYVLPLVSHNIFFGYIFFDSEDIELITYEYLSNEIAKVLNNVYLEDKKKYKYNMLKQSTEKLKDNEEKLKEITDLLPIMIVECDLNFKVTYYNKTALKELSLVSNENTFLRNIVVREDLNKMEYLVWQLKNKDEIIEYPGIRFFNRATNRIIPAARISGVYDKLSGKLTKLLWNLFNPLPLITCAIMPDKSFYNKFGISSREQDVVTQILQGLTIKSIAKKLFISESTVKGHMSRIYSKFKVTGKPELVKTIKEHQVDQHGYSNYLFSVMNTLLSIENK